MTSSKSISSSIRIILANAVHVFTATGVVAGFLALDSIVNEQWQMVFLWMGIALLIDMVDGTVARAMHVKEILPNFDGGLLDNLIDYFNYVIIPAVLLYNAHLMPEGWELWGAVIITMSSAYQFCQTDAKTQDHYFKGFPSYWNITVIYFMFLGLDPLINFGIIVLLGIMVFIPVKYIYPSRTKEFRILNLVLTCIWGIAFVIMIFMFPNSPVHLVHASLIYIAYFFLVSFYITIQKKRGIL